MMRFQDISWEISVIRNTSLFDGFCRHLGLARYSKLFAMPPRYPVSIVTEHGTRTALFVPAGANDPYRSVVKELCLSPRFAHLAGIYTKYGEQLLHASTVLEHEPSRKHFRAFVKAYQVYQPALSVTNIIGKVMHTRLIEELKKKYPSKSQQEIEMVVGTITYPTRHSPLMASQISLLKIGACVQKKDALDLQKMVHAHLKHFMHIPVNFNEEPWSESDIHEQLKDILRKDCDVELVRMKHVHQNRGVEARKILRQINDPLITTVAHTLQVGSYLNEYRKGIFSRASLAYRPLFKAIAEKYNLASWKEVWKLTPREIEALWFDGDIKVLQVLSHRDGVMGLVSDAKAPEGFRFLPQRTVKKFLQEVTSPPPLLDKERKGEVSEIHGIIANRGLVTGTARLIFSRADFHKFHDGDILIAPMTSVDFVPLMQRAAAFVTDEGGITSHPSIVSREMDKPCIIGTRIATKVFKDGDMIEVDAEHGVVRKL